jgi:hypothetical protein
MLSERSGVNDPPRPQTTKITTTNTCRMALWFVENFRGGVTTVGKIVRYCL